MVDTQDPFWFGPYRLSLRIGTGGMGEVYLGRHAAPEGKLDRPVAIKRLFPHLARDVHIVRMFLNEARITAQIDHPNVVKILEVGHVNGEPFIAMELLEGHSFAETRERAAQMGRPVPLGITLRVLTDACRGLGAAHRATDEEGRLLCIVHRDFTPDNIHIGVQGAVKVIDFGIARAENIGSGTEPGALKGKYFYMSPEMIIGKKVDHRADVFAAGVMLYEQLCGRRPFTGAESHEILTRIAEGKPRFPTEFDPSVPLALEAICLRALARDPEQRFASLEDLVTAIEEVGGAADLASHEELGKYVSYLFPADEDPKRQAIRLAIQANRSLPGPQVAPPSPSSDAAPRKQLATPAGVAGTARRPVAPRPSPEPPGVASALPAATPAPPTPRKTAATLAPAPRKVPAPVPVPSSEREPTQDPPEPRHERSAGRGRLLAALVAIVLLAGGAVAMRTWFFPYRPPVERLADAQAKPDAAASLLESLADDPAATAEQLTLAGEILLSASASNSALTLAEGFARRFPKDPAAPLLEARAAIHLRLGKRAEAAVERAQALAPADVSPVLVLVELRQAQGDIPGAVDALAQARKRSPESTELAVRQGRLLSQAERLDEAAEVLSASLQRRFDAGVAAELGFVRFRQEQLDEALGLLHRALKKAPRLFEAHYYLGAVLFRQGDAKGAERTYREAAALARPDDPRALVALCEIQAHGGDAKAAQATRELIASRFPKQAAELTARCKP